jgi:hypothetical protein
VPARPRCQAEDASGLLASGGVCSSAQRVRQRVWEASGGAAGHNAAAVAMGAAMVQRWCGGGEDSMWSVARAARKLSGDQQALQRGQSSPRHALSVLKPSCVNIYAPRPPRASSGFRGFACRRRESAAQAQSSFHPPRTVCLGCRAPPVVDKCIIIEHGSRQPPRVSDNAPAPPSNAAAPASLAPLPDRVIRIPPIRNIASNLEAPAGRLRQVGAIGRIARGELLLTADWLSCRRGVRCCQRGKAAARFCRPLRSPAPCPTQSPSRTRAGASGDG